MLAAVIESKEVEDPGTGTTTVRIDPNDRQPDDPGTRTMSVEIDPTACQDQDDPGTGMTSVKTDPRLSGTRRPRDQDDNEESGSHRLSRLGRSRDPDESRDDRARGSGQSRQPTSNRPPPLYHQLFQHGRQDLDTDWLLSPVADG